MFRRQEVSPANRALAGSCPLSRPCGKFTPSCKLPVEVRRRFRCSAGPPSGRSVPWKIRARSPGPPRLRQVSSLHPSPSPRSTRRLPAGVLLVTIGIITATVLATVASLAAGAGSTAESPQPAQGGGVPGGGETSEYRTDFATSTGFASIPGSTSPVDSSSAGTPTSGKGSSGAHPTGSTALTSTPDAPTDTQGGGTTTTVQHPTRVTTPTTTTITFTPTTTTTTTTTPPTTSGHPSSGQRP